MLTDWDWITVSGGEKRSMVSDLDIPLLTTSVMKGKLDALSSKLDILRRRVETDLKGAVNSEGENASSFELVRDAVYSLKTPDWPAEDMGFTDLLCTSNTCFVDSYPVRF